MSSITFTGLREHIGVVAFRGAIRIRAGGQGPTGPVGPIGPGGVPSVSTRSALKALDTTNDTTAIFDGSVWEFTNFNFTSLHALDTGEGVYIKADAIASAVGGWTRKHDGVLNAKWFNGVTGDGVTNDAAAITQALRLNSLFEIYFPEGVYLCNATITREGGYVNIRGAGQYNTQFKFGDTDGFSFGQTTPVLHAHMRDVGVLTTAATTTRRAVLATFDRTSAQKNPSCIFERMDIRGDVTTTDWWQKGIRVVNPALPIFRDLQFFGRSGGTSAQLTTLASLAIEMRAENILCVCPIFDNVFGLDWHKGIKVESTGNPGAEGIYVTHCNFTHCNYGVHGESTGGGGYKNAQTHVINNQFQCYIRGVWLDECKHFNVSDNLLYGDGTTTTEGVYVEDCVYGNIGRNQVEQLGSVTMKGVVVHNSANVTVTDTNAETSVSAVDFTGFTFECKEFGTVQNGTGAKFTNTAGTVTNDFGVRDTLAFNNPNNILGGGGTQYLGSGQANATESVASMVVPVAGVLRNLRGVNTIAPGGVQTTTYTVMKNGVAQTLTCQVVGAGLTADDVANQVSVARGDTISVRATSSATAVNTLNKATVDFFVQQ